MLAGFFMFMGVSSSCIILILIASTLFSMLQSITTAAYIVEKHRGDIERIDHLFDRIKDLEKEKSKNESRKK